MTELWEILLPPRPDWPQGVEHVGSVYMPYGASQQEVIAAAVRRFRDDALAYRRSVPGPDLLWTFIEGVAIDTYDKGMRE